MNKFDLLVKKILSETKEETIDKLYHATLVDNIPSILSNGLTPTVGEWTKSLYRNKAEPLVFAADLRGSRNVYCALDSQIRRKLNKKELSAEDIAKYGAIVVISKNVNRFKQHISNKNQGSIEPGNYFSPEIIKIDEVITGQNLLQWLKTHNADWGEIKCSI